MLLYFLWGRITDEVSGGGRGGGTAGFIGEETCACESLLASSSVLRKASVRGTAAPPALGKASSATFKTVAVASAGASVHSSNSTATVVTPRAAMTRGGGAVPRIAPTRQLLRSPLLPLSLSLSLAAVAYCTDALTREAATRHFTPHRKYYTIIRLCAAVLWSPVPGRSSLLRVALWICVCTLDAACHEPHGGASRYGSTPAAS